MNPFTRFLSQWGGNPQIEQLITHWDTVEFLAIHVYKQKKASADEETQYQVAKKWLDQHYHHWASDLEPYWRESAVGGTLDHVDPFRFLFENETATGFVDNWKALQHLPAAREALNQFLVTQGETK